MHNISACRLIDDNWRPCALAFVCVCFVALDLDVDINGTALLHVDKVFHGVTHGVSLNMSFCTKSLSHYVDLKI